MQFLMRYTAFLFSALAAGLYQSQLTVDASSFKHFDIVSVVLEGWTDTRNGDFSVLVPVHPP